MQLTATAQPELHYETRMSVIWRNVEFFHAENFTGPFPPNSRLEDLVAAIQRAWYSIFCVLGTLGFLLHLRLFLVSSFRINGKPWANH
jgi:hypothetical protein